MPIKYRQAHKMLLDNGWELLKTGKGSHRRYGKKGHKPFTLDWHGGNKDLKKYMEKSLLKELGK